MFVLVSHYNIVYIDQLACLAASQFNFVVVIIFLRHYTAVLYHACRNSIMLGSHMID